MLITGGGSGIGAGLAAAFHARGHQVVVAGHGLERIKAVASRHSGMAAELVDVADAEQVAGLAARAKRHWPDLATVVSSAGVQTMFDFPVKNRSIRPNWRAR